MQTNTVMNTVNTVIDEFAEHRPLLFAIAYRMLSSVADAEDVVQEAFLRWHKAQQTDHADGGDIRSAKAWLSAVTTRLCLDHLRSARVRRETYPGPWLPEPLLADADTPDPAETVADSETVSMAFLLMLDRLTPAERAAFLLHDVFDYDYAELGNILDRSEAACRQLTSRARRHVSENRPRFEPSPRRRDELADRFFAALAGDDIDGLVSLLAEDVVVVGDGGGTRPSWPRAIHGRDTVARLLTATIREALRLHLSMERTLVNGQPGVVLRGPNGGLINVMTVDVVDGEVRTVRSVINPAKLGHLGPLEDRTELLRQWRELRAPSAIVGDES